jgi:hypothetical protein
MQYSRLGLAMKYARWNHAIYNARKALIVLTVIATVYGPAVRRDWRFRTEGVVISANVEGKSSQQGRKGGGGYRLSYSFTVNGQVIRRDEQTPKEFWEPVKPFGSVDVTYLPSDPNVCRVGPPDQQTVPWLFVGMAAIASVIVVGFGKGAWEVSRQLTLTIHGSPVLARITLVDREGHRIEYSYLAGPLGEEQLYERSTDAVCASIKRMAVGDVVLVLHSDQDAGRSQIDWFDARAEERQLLMEETARQAKLSV